MLQLRPLLCGCSAAVRASVRPPGRARPVDTPPHQPPLRPSPERAGFRQAHAWPQPDYQQAAAGRERRAGGPAQGGGRHTRVPTLFVSAQEHAWILAPVKGDGMHGSAHIPARGACFVLPGALLLPRRLLGAAPCRCPRARARWPRCATTSTSPSSEPQRSRALHAPTPHRARHPGACKQGQPNRWRQRCLCACSPRQSLLWAAFQAVAARLCPGAGTWRPGWVATAACRCTT